MTELVWDRVEDRSSKRASIAAFFIPQTGIFRQHGMVLSPWPSPLGARLSLIIRTV
jgi:hypothetical protein